jgi:hypothetical protein
LNQYKKSERPPANTKSETFTIFLCHQEEKKTTKKSMSFDGEIPSDELTCESQWLERQYLSFAVSTAAAVFFFVASGYNMMQASKTRFPVQTAYIEFLLFGIYTSKAVALFGHFWLAQAIEHFAQGILYLSVLDVIVSEYLGQRKRPPTMFHLGVVYLFRGIGFVSIACVILLGFGYNITTILLSLIPAGLIFVQLLIWICAPPHARMIEDSRTSESGRQAFKLAGFLVSRSLLAAVAFVFWSFDFWMCNSTTRYGFYAVYVFLSAYVSHELNKFFGFLLSCQAGYQPTFSSGWFFSTLKGAPIGDNETSVTPGAEQQQASASSTVAVALVATANKATTAEFALH